jgi:hypothetical protein
MKKPYFIITETSQSVPAFIDSINIEELDAFSTENVSYFIIDDHNIDQLTSVFRKLRTQKAPAAYLKPVLLLTRQTHIIPEVAGAADASHQLDAFNEQVAEQYASRFNSINQWIDNLPETAGYTDTNIPIRLLRFMASRNREIMPMATSRRRNGYVYPLLDPFLDNSDSGILETLDFLHEQKLVTGRFITKSHFCSHCDCAFLNFEETCPHCDSHDLRIDELIHHFKCAYTGESSEFRQGNDRLVCPKCERQLQHIGVDYDKPSIVYQCNDCNHTFQDPKIISTCFDCGRSTEPENQSIRTIQAYSLTSIGQNTALYGMESLFTNILETELKLYSFSAFRDFFMIEAARIKRYRQSNSSLVMIHFKGLDQLYVHMGKEAKNVFAELSAVFNSILRTTDITTARNESLFLVVMTETNKDQAQIAVNRLKEGVEALFANNLDFQLEIDVMIEQIKEDTDTNVTLERFLGHDTL